MSGDISSDRRGDIEFKIGFSMAIDLAQDAMRREMRNEFSAHYLQAAIKLIEAQVALAVEINIDFSQHYFFRGVLNAKSTAMLFEKFDCPGQFGAASYW